MKALCDWLLSLQNALARAEMRAPVIWQADAARIGAELARCPLPSRTLWLHSGGKTPLQPPPGVVAVRPNQAQHFLGDEWAMLLVDGFSGVDANMLLALAGTLTPGGILLMLLPPEAPDTPNGALGRHLSFGVPLPQRSLWLRRILHTPGALRPFEPVPALPLPPPRPDPVPTQVLKPEQIWLIEGRRGRGKSALLACIADDHEARHVVLISQHRRATGSFRRHLQALGWGVPPKNRRVDFFRGERTLKILPPDAFLAQKPACGLLLIDEAARITLPVLKKLLETDSPIVMASTQEGYEGSGQGLRLKLPHLLPAKRTLHSLHLDTPWRWQPEDRLERWLDALCLLDTPALPAPQGPVEVMPWWPDEDEATLPAVFALLRQAHHQTRPSDLMQLLDRPDQRLWVARTRTDQIVAVLWALEEGGLTAPPDHVRGHLAAQRLRQLTGEDAWLRRRSLRITRIAVHPARRREGIGTALIERLKRQADVDFLSVSCPAEPALEAFWQKQGFRLIHRGDRPNRASGVPSALLIYDLRS